MDDPNKLDLKFPFSNSCLNSHFASHGFYYNNKLSHSKHFHILIRDMIRYITIQWGRKI